MAELDDEIYLVSLMSAHLLAHNPLMQVPVAVHMARELVKETKRMGPTGPFPCTITKHEE